MDPKIKTLNQYGKDPNITALTRKGFSNQGSTLLATGNMWATTGPPLPETLAILLGLGFIGLIGY